MRECGRAQNKEKCSCTYEPCDTKGVCCEWLRYHWQSGELPACFFPDDVEKTHDRSIGTFIETYQKRERWRTTAQNR